MIFLSDCICRSPDEGADRLATRLAELLHRQGATVLSVNRAAPPYSTVTAGWLFGSGSLRRTLRQARAPVVYLPKSAATPATALRCLALRTAGCPVWLLLTENKPLHRLTRALLRASHANFMVLSDSAAQALAGLHRPVHVLRTGVDCDRFAPVPAARKAQLKRQYGFPPDRSVILHVGHLKAGRGLRQLRPLTALGTVALVCSASTAHDEALRQELESAGIRIFDAYQPHIEEFYQCADLYAFPVTEAGNCIELPLSVLEAAAADLPILAAPYGALQSWQTDAGFRFWNPNDPAETRAAAAQLLEAHAPTRFRALPYDFTHAAVQMAEWVRGAE